MPGSHLIKLGPRFLHLCLLLSALLFAGRAAAQSTTPTDGYTPSALTPGAPAGSYPLGGVDNVNPYNGNLNFNLPLLRVGGRGGASFTMQLPVAPKWIIQHDVVEDPETNNRWDFDSPLYELNGAVAYYGAGTLKGRRVGDGVGTHAPYCTYGSGSYYRTLTRLTFTAPDGSEMELRDQLTNGQYATVPYCASGGASRGTIFTTSDGTSATFVSDATIYDEPSGANPVIYPSGYLYFRDGTRYRVEEGVAGIRDRNGNKMTLSYGGITDSLGRQITVESVNDVAPYGLCDRITVKGFGGTPRVVRVSRTTLGNALRAGEVLKTVKTLWPELNNASPYYNHDPQVISSVWLPDGRRYRLYYNSYGELARVELPTGGAIEYDWAAGANGTSTSGAYNTMSYVVFAYRRVVERRVYANGGAGNSYDSRMTISRPESTSDGTNFSNVGYADVKQFNPAGTLLSASRHYYFGSPTASLVNGTAYPLGANTWKEGREWQTEAFAADGATALRRVTHTWQQPAAGYTWPLTQPETSDAAQTNDPQITQTLTTVEPSGANLVSKQSFAFDQYGNQTDAWEYDYGAGTPGALLRHTHTDYVTGSAYTSHTGAHLRSLPSAQQVYGVVGGVETLVAKSETLYDQYGLAGYTSVSGWEDPQRAARGNPTTQRHWLDTPTGWIETHANYDQVGNVVSATDARNNTATVSYTDVFADSVSRNTYAFPTQKTSPVPDPSNQRATNTPLVTSAVYDYWTGLTASATDANGKTTHIQYNDTLDRLTRVDRPDGGWTVYWYARNQYGDYVGTRTAINASQNTEGYQFSDGLGRPARSFQHDGSQWITSDTQYDALGRTWRVSANPYLTGGSGSPVNPSGHWVETTYDALGRPTHVKTTADNAQVVTAYSGNTVRVTDQAGKQRTSVSDALGRLTRVVEDPFGLAYQTDYTYDALGNLRKVNQGGQLRHFMYDSLGRLIRAKNPEQTGAISADADFPSLTDPVTGNGQWSLGYAYDANGNLHKRRDARNVTATYQYDNVNRVKQTSYSDSTPLTLFTYDFATNGRGRFYADYESSTSGTINYVFAYDAAGRPTSRRTDFHLNGTGWVGYYSASRAYDRAGNVTAQTYPSGRTVNYTQFDAAGRLKAVSGNLGDGVTRTYAAGRNLVTGAEEGIQYDAAGRILEEKYGTQTPLYHKRHYNARGQLYDVRLSSVPWHQDHLDWNRGALLNYYTAQGGWAPGASGTDNSGNVKLAQHWVPNGQGGYDWMNQYYEYDDLNRISYVQEQQNGGAYTGQQHYAYDPWGNRTINTGSTSGAGIHNRQFAVDTATNRLGVPANQTGSMVYDDAGNLTNDTYTGGGGRAYDAENRMTSAWGYSALVGGPFQNRYVYDAAGKRVRRQTDAGETWHVYGFDGELIAEYAANGAAAQPQKEYGYRAGGLLVVAEAGGQVRWLVSDHLGTPRMTADLSGSLTGIKRHDYLPFGEEIGAGVGGRTQAQGYSADNVRQKFTGYERDSETKLDYAQARYYASEQGRFAAVDPLLASGRPPSPQTWNRYAYSLNNPLRYTDPTGLNPEDVGTAEDQERQRQEQQPPPPPTTQTATPIRVDTGPDPLPPGVAPIPTTIVYTVGQAQQYNGRPIILPDGPNGTPLSHYTQNPVYGVASINPVVVLDQGGNPMGPETGVQVTESITPASPDAQRLAEQGSLGSSGQRPARRGEDGRFYDVIRNIYPTPAERDAVYSRQFDVTVNQRLYVRMPGERAPVLTMRNQHQITNKGINTTLGKSEKWGK